MSEAARFEDLGFRKQDFMIPMTVYSNCTYFSPMDIRLRLRSVQQSASEVDLVLRNTVPSTQAMGHENHEKFDEKWWENIF